MHARLIDLHRARAHAKAGGKAIEISAYLGSGAGFSDALNKYALAYADQNEADYTAFIRACRSGRLESRGDEDMAADFRI